MTISDKLLTMVDKVKKIINNHTFTIDQQTIDHFNKKYAEGGYTSLFNCQAELLEYSLERCGLLIPTDTYRNDGKFSFWPELKPDFKRKPKNRNNVSISNWSDKKLESVYEEFTEKLIDKNGELNYFMELYGFSFDFDSIMIKRLLDPLKKANSTLRNLNKILS